MNRRFIKAFALPTPPVVCAEVPGVVVDPMRPGERIDILQSTGTADDRCRMAKILGRKGGLKGGHARAAKLTPEQRSAIAKKGAKARWKKSRKAKSAKPASTA